MWIMGFPDLLEGKLGGQVPGHFLPFSLAPGVGSVGEGAAQATPGSELSGQVSVASVC